MSHNLAFTSVADAHVLALTKPEAQGRFVISAGPWCTQQLTETILSIAPNSPGVPKGKEGAVEEANNLLKINTSYGVKAERELGIRYKSIEESARDSALFPLVQTRGYSQQADSLQWSPVYQSLKARGW